MRILGPRLFWPKAAAIALGIYALCYGLLLMILVFGSINDTANWGVVIGLLAMAATPFVALVHLGRATAPNHHPPARPQVLALVMAVPSLFWLYTTGTVLRPLAYLTMSDIMTIVGFVLVPALLSVWLTVAFAMLAWRGRLNDDPQTATAPHDIE